MYYQNEKIERNFPGKVKCAIRAHFVSVDTREPEKPERLSRHTNAKLPDQYSETTYGERFYGETTPNGGALTMVNYYIMHGGYLVYGELEVGVGLHVESPVNDWPERLLYAYIQSSGRMVAPLNGEEGAPARGLDCRAPRLVTSRDVICDQLAPRESIHSI